MLLQQGHAARAGRVRRTIDMVQADERPSEVLTTEVLRGSKGRTVRPKSSGQKRYIDAIRRNVITFGIGPGGHGQDLAGGRHGGAGAAGQAGRAASS